MPDGCPSRFEQIRRPNTLRERKDKQIAIAGYVTDYYGLLWIGGVYIA